MARTKFVAASSEESDKSVGSPSGSVEMGDVGKDARSSRPTLLRIVSGLGGGRIGWLPVESGGACDLWSYLLDTITLSPSFCRLRWPLSWLWRPRFRGRLRSWRREPGGSRAISNGTE